MRNVEKNELTENLPFPLLSLFGVGRMVPREILGRSCYVGLETKLCTFRVEIMVETIIGLVASGAAIVLWWLQNRAATKEEKRKQDAAKLHKDTSDIIDSSFD